VNDRTFAEFFAGIGLVRLALERQGFHARFANDIDRVKLELYSANFGSEGFLLRDVRQVSGGDIPTVDLATASFPCTDLSLAGWRRGLAGDHSGLFWEFARILQEMGARGPRAVLIENVPSFATSKNGEDLHAAISVLNSLGFWCDIFVVDASNFVPQSRQRLFIVGSREPLPTAPDWTPTKLRPAWIWRFVKRHRDLMLNALPLELPSRPHGTVAQVIEEIPDSDSRWWDQSRTNRFCDSLQWRHKARLTAMQQSAKLNWATAYRRTRSGKAVWEIRPDSISGCLRTSRGGSSKQAIVEAGQGKIRVRWMTRLEYARLQGAPEFRVPQQITEGQALFGFGDAVCVPVIEWLAGNYLQPLIDGDLAIQHRPAATMRLALPLSAI